MCLMKGSCSSTVATRPFMGAGTCVSGSPHSGNESQLPILRTHAHRADVNVFVIKLGSCKALVAGHFHIGQPTSHSRTTRPRTCLLNRDALHGSADLATPSRPEHKPIVGSSALMLTTHTSAISRTQETVCTGPWGGARKHSMRHMHEDEVFVGVRGERLSRHHAAVSEVAPPGIPHPVVQEPLLPLRRSAGSRQCRLQNQGAQPRH